MMNTTGTPQPEQPFNGPRLLPSEPMGGMAAPQQPNNNGGMQQGGAMKPAKPAITGLIQHFVNGGGGIAGEVEGAATSGVAEGLAAAL